MNIIWTLFFWIPLGLVFVVLSLMDPANAKSQLWFAALFLYMLMVHLLWKGRDKPRDSVAMPMAPLAYIGLSLLFGGVFEASLTVDGTGFGGMHPETLSSFALAFGDYTLMALAFLVLVRLLRLDFKQGYFLAAGISLSEGLVFNGVLIRVALSSEWYFLPLLLGFYALAYASFLALPLLVLPYGTLWRNNARPGWVTIPLLWIIGLFVGVLTRLIFALIYAPSVANWLSIQIYAT
jgi:hypothetical protein